MIRLRSHVIAIVLLAGAAAVSFAAATSVAEEMELPPWLSEEVISAAMSIGLSDEQLGPFRANVREFLEDFQREVQQIIRRGEMGIENQVQRTRNSLARQMDKRMAETLRDEQMAPYQNYRAALLKSLEPG